MTEGRGKARRWRRIAVRTLVGIVAAPFIYLLAALLLALIPGNPFSERPEQGIRIYVADNGAHTDIALPLVNDVMDWRPLLPAQHLRNPQYGNYILVGFGDRDFYLNTPSWAELSFGTAFNAMWGLGDTVVHVEHSMEPQATPDVRAITLTPDEYRRLAAYVQGTFRAGPDGRPVWIDGTGYGPSDTFYEAQGRYTLFRTCNTWTGETLRAAGVRAGLWTPFPAGVMFWLPGPQN